MRSLTLIAVLVPLLFVVGCAKRTAKKPAADDEPSVAKPKVQPPVPNAPGNKKADEPNWLNDPRFKNDPSHVPLPTEAPPNGKPGWGSVGPPKDGWTPPVAGVQPATGVPGPGPVGIAPPVPAPGVVPVPPKPAPPVAGTTTSKYSPVTEADMKEIWVFVENRFGATGKMPSQLDIYQALVAASFKSGALVKDGSIHLTGATTRESIWAFETKALTSGGLVVTQNGVETLTAAELKKRLGK